MAKYEGELKDNLKTVRLTDTTVSLIEQFPEGSSFNGKLEKLVSFCMNPDEAIKEKLEIYDKLSKDIAELECQRGRLSEDVKKLDKAAALFLKVSKSVDQLYKFTGEIIGDDIMDKDIKQRISAAGYQSNKRLEEKIRRIDLMTGKENSISSIADAFKESIYQDQPELQKLVNEVSKEFQAQELHMEIEV